MPLPPYIVAQRKADEELAQKMGGMLPGLR